MTASEDHDLFTATNGGAVVRPCRRDLPDACLLVDHLTRATRPNRRGDASDHAREPVIVRVEGLIVWSENPDEKRGDDCRANKAADQTDGGCGEGGPAESFPSQISRTPEPGEEGEDGTGIDRQSANIAMGAMIGEMKMKPEITHDERDRRKNETEEKRS